MDCANTACCDFILRKVFFGVKGTKRRHRSSDSCCDAALAENCTNELLTRCIKNAKDKII